ncbi:hypothetical protein BD410DRAFT_790177 [Rickenella mellea]|uniref:Uncharacterized protein n=1 Tax=Rickenella mellea TaxID=50990 RepID=A0A4Y7Q134_9AGAM|nr:hypothetical protein BD410DRAFT_790177 [Rickenella mellea]
MAHVVEYLGGFESACLWCDRQQRLPAGCTMRNCLLATDYENQIRILMFAKPDATRREVRWNLLPPVVAKIYENWSPQKLEYLVSAGVRIWFDRGPVSHAFQSVASENEGRQWEEFQEECMKTVHTFGFQNGKGDRAMFGWTLEGGDKYFGSYDESNSTKASNGRFGNDSDTEEEAIVKPKCEPVATSVLGTKRTLRTRKTENAKAKANRSRCRATPPTKKCRKATQKRHTR